MNAPATPQARMMCPHCQAEPMDSSSRVPYVRGVIVAMIFGWNTQVGCNTCVRKGHRSEAGKSALIGWFSAYALFLNPLLIGYNLLMGVFVGRNPQKVDRMLEKAGLGSGNVDFTTACYGLGAAMISADGKVDKRELQTAAALGDRLVPGFDLIAFTGTVKEQSLLPSPAILAQMLDPELSLVEKERLMAYLTAITVADGNVDSKEVELLALVADKFNLVVTGNNVLAYGEGLVNRFLNEEAPSAEDQLMALADA